MKHPGMWWWILSKRLIRQPFFWICMSLFVILPILMTKELAKQGVGVRVLVLDQTDSSADAKLLIQALMQRNDTGSVITFEQSDDEQQMREQIVGGYAQAGYILPPDFSERLKRWPDSGQPVLTAVRSDREVSVRVIDEIVYGCIYDRIAEPIARDYAQSLTGREDESRDRFLRERYDAYLGMEMPFLFQHADGSPFTDFEEEPERNAARLFFPVQGLVGVLIALTALGGGVLWYQDDRRRVFLHASRTGRWIIHLFYVLIPTILSALTGWLVICLVGAGTPLWEAFRMLCYVGMLVPVLYLIQWLVRPLGLYMALIPVITVCNLIGGSVFAELSEVPALTWLQKLIPLYYVMQL